MCVYIVRARTRVCVCTHTQNTFDFSFLEKVLGCETSVNVTLPWNFLALIYPKCNHFFIQ